MNFVTDTAIEVWTEAIESARAAARPAGRPEEVADVVLFLTGPAAAFVTGQALCADGGFSVQG